MQNKTLQYNLMIAILLFTVAGYQLLHITGPVLYPDEFGYWANSAWWLSFDWSDTVSLQPYYSFGYSILLFPILKYIKSPFLIYRAAVLVNISLVYFHAVILWKIVQEWDKNERPVNSQPSQWYCLLAAIYPGILFYMQVTLTECLLSFCFALIVWLFMKFEQTGKGKYGVLFVLMLVYLYFVHMRTVGVLIAGIIGLCLSIMRSQKTAEVSAKNHKKNYKLLQILLFMTFLIVLLIAGSFLKELLQNGLYGKADSQLLAVNDYKGRVNSLYKVFSWKGIGEFIVSSAGKLFYVGIATLGTFYYGFWHLFHRCRRNACCLFLLLSFLFTFGIIAVTVTEGERGDVYLYGRYIEFLMPVLIYLGLLEMSTNRHVFRVTTVAISINGLISLMLVYIMEAQKINPVLFQGYFVVGISYVLQERMADISRYILYPYVAGSIVMFLLALVMGLFIRRKRKFVCYLGLFAGLFIYTAVSAGCKYLYDHSIDTGADMNMANAINQEIDDGNSIVFLNSESDALYVDIIQFCMRERPLVIVQDENMNCALESAKNAEFVLTYRNSPYEKSLDRDYDTSLLTYHFRLYYNKE